MSKKNEERLLSSSKRWKVYYRYYLQVRSRSLALLSGAGF